MTEPTPLTPQDRAAIAAAVLRHYRKTEAYDLSGIVLCEMAERMSGSPGAQDAMVIVYARIGLDLNVDTFAAAEKAIVGFNDWPNRTFADVVALCEKVARTLEAETQD